MKKTILIILICFPIILFGQTKYKYPVYDSHGSINMNSAALIFNHIGKRILMKQHCTDQISENIVNGVFQYSNIILDKHKLSASYFFKDTILEKIIIISPTYSDTLLKYFSLYGETFQKINKTTFILIKTFPNYIVTATIDRKKIMIVMDN